MVKFEPRDTTLTPVTQIDQDVRNVLSGLWSTRSEDSPWVTSEEMVSSTGPSSVIDGDSMVVGRLGNDKRLSQTAVSDYGQAQDEEDLLQMYEDMSSCPSDSRSSGVCSSAASSRSGSSSSSESMW